MSSRRRRKRKYPRHVDCDSLPKRHQFLLHSSRQHSRHADEQSQLVVADEEAAEETAQVSLLEHLSLSLPANLVCSLSMSKNRLFRDYLYHSFPLYNSTSFLVNDTPSFCISRFSIALTNGADLKSLLFEVSSMERNIHTNMLHCTCDHGYQPNYIVLSCDPNDSVHLPIITNLPSMNGFHKNAFSSRWYKVRLVLCENMKESERETRISGGEDGDVSKSGSDVEMREESSSASGRESGGGGSGGALLGVNGEAQTVCEEENCMEEGGGSAQELVGIGETQVGVAGGGGQGEQVEGVFGAVEGVFGGDRCVEVEVWVEGVMCQPSDPSALPLGGNSTSLGKVMKIFHPDISEEAESNSSRRCKWQIHCLI